MHVDGGSNVHICTDKSLFYQLKSTTSGMQQVSGTQVSTKGIGVVIIKFPIHNYILPLYPVYYIPTNPQNTLSPSAIKLYNEYSNINVSTLTSITFTTHKGHTFTIPTDKQLATSKLLDFITVHVLQKQNPKTNKNNKNNIISPYLHFPLISNSTSFIKTPIIDRILLHRRMMHLSDNKMELMCKDQTLLNLPNKLKPKNKNECPCIICIKAKFNHPPRGITQSTDSILPGALLHMYFKFYNVVSIRGFTSVFTIIDAKTRKLWCFPGPDKRPPIYKLEFFFKTLKSQDITVKEIRVDEGGELAHSTEF